MKESEGAETAFWPLDIIDQLGLQQQISLGQQVITDKVLIGSHRYTVTHTQRAEHIQNLKKESVGTRGRK